MAIQPTGRLAGYRRSGAGGQAEMTSKLSLKLPSQKVSTFDGFALVGFPLMNFQEDLEELGSLISFANLEHVVKFGAQLV